MAERGNYKKAAEIFKAVVVEGNAPMEITTACFRAQLCIFVDSAMQDDVANAQFYDDVLSAVSAKWAASQEREILKKLMAAFQQGASGVRAYTKTCGEFNATYPLDSWTVAMLLKIKRVMLGEFEMSDSDDDDEDDGKKKGGPGRDMSEAVSDLLR